VKLIQEWGEGGIIVRTFVNVTMYSQYNNNMIIKKKKKENLTKSDLMFKKKENKQPKNVGKDTGTLLAGM
jgi:hypothetical protein